MDTHQSSARSKDHHHALAVFFVQHVPFRDLRLVRLTENGTKVYSLPSNFSERIPHAAALDTVVARSGGLLEYDRTAETLTVHGKLDNQRYRDLLTSYGIHPDRAVIEGVLRGLRDRTLLFIDEGVLQRHGRSSL